MAPVGNMHDNNLALLREFFVQNVPTAAGTPIDEGTGLLGTGLLDSLSVIQLMVFLGERLGVEIEDDDFVPENLGTVGQLLAFLQRKQGSHAS